MYHRERQAAPAPPSETSNSNAASTPVPFSPFSSAFSINSDSNITTTSDEGPDLGAFSTIFRALSQLQRPIRTSASPPVPGPPHILSSGSARTHLRPRDPRSGSSSPTPSGSPANYITDLPPDTETEGEAESTDFHSHLSASDEDSPFSSPSRDYAYSSAGEDNALESDAYISELYGGPPLRHPRPRHPASRSSSYSRRTGTSSSAQKETVWTQGVVASYLAPPTPVPVLPPIPPIPSSSVSMPMHARHSRNDSVNERLVFRPHAHSRSRTSDTQRDYNDESNTDVGMKSSSTPIPPVPISAPIPAPAPVLVPEPVLAPTQVEVETDPDHEYEPLEGEHDADLEGIFNFQTALAYLAAERARLSNTNSTTSNSHVNAQSTHNIVSPATTSISTASTLSTLLSSYGSAIGDAEEYSYEPAASGQRATDTPSLPGAYSNNPNEEAEQQSPSKKPMNRKGRRERERERERLRALAAAAAILDTEPEAEGAALRSGAGAAPSLSYEERGEREREGTGSASGYADLRTGRIQLDPHSFRQHRHLGTSPSPEKGKGRNTNGQAQSSLSRRHEGSSTSTINLLSTQSQPQHRSHPQSHLRSSSDPDHDEDPVPNSHLPLQLTASSTPATPTTLALRAHLLGLADRLAEQFPSDARVLQKMRFDVGRITDEGGGGLVRWDEGVDLPSLVEAEGGKEGGRDYMGGRLGGEVGEAAIAEAERVEEDIRAGRKGRVHVFIDHSNILIGFLAWIKKQFATHPSFASASLTSLSSIASPYSASASSPLPSHSNSPPLTLPSKPKLSHLSLLLLLERGRKVGKRVLVGSSPLYQTLRDVGQSGYQLSVMNRVRIEEGLGAGEGGVGEIWEERDGAKRPKGGKGKGSYTRNGNGTGTPNGSTNPAGAGAGTATGSGGSSTEGRTGNGSTGTGTSSRLWRAQSTGHRRNPSASAAIPSGTGTSSPTVNGMPGGYFSNANSNLASGTSTPNGNNNGNGTSTPSGSTNRPRYREEAVDELLQLKVMQLLTRSPTPPPRGSTIVLATGDGASSQFNRDGFYGCVRDAVSKGWRVELVGWEEGRSARWNELLAEVRAGKRASGGGSGGGLVMISLEKWGWDLFDSRTSV